MKFHLERVVKKGRLYYSYKASYRERGKVKSKRVYIGAGERGPEILSDFASKNPDQEQCYSYTGEILLGEVAKRLNFSKIVAEHVHHDTKWDAGKFLEILVVERCLNPASKWALAQRVHKESILSLQSDIPSAAFSDDNLYNYMDYVQPVIHSIQADLVERVYRIFPAGNEVLILDGTSLTAHGADTLPQLDELDGEDPGNSRGDPPDKKGGFPVKHIARVNGYSRDKRPDLPQINVMLGVDQMQIPLYFEVFAGNTADVVMFNHVLRRLDTSYRGLLKRMKRCYLIFDRGNVNPENIQQIDQLCDSWQVHFIGGVKSVMFKHELAALDNDQPPEIFRQGKTVLNGKTVKKKLYGKPRDVLLYVSQAVRKHKLLKFQDKLDKVQSLLIEIDSKEGLLPAQKVHGMKTILRKHSMVRLFWLQKFNKDGTPEEPAGSPPALYHPLPAEIEAKKALFGRFAVLTSDSELKAEEIIRLYKSKEIVEHEFHLLKSLLAIKPFYHSLPNRIDAHVAIVHWGMLLLSVLKSLLAQEGLSYSFEGLSRVIRRGLLQKATYHYPGYKSFRLTRVNGVTPELERIVSLLKLKIQPFHIEDWSLQSR